MNKKNTANDTAEKFLEMVSAHKGIIYKIANCYCHDRHERQDLIQEIVAQLWRSRDRYDDAYARSTWVYRIALNVSISSCRKASRRKPVSEPTGAALIDTGDHEEQIVLGEQVSLLHQFIGELKAIDRALMLLFLEEKSHREIAGVLGMTATNVATKLGRIKQKLKQRFLEQEQNHE